MAVSTEANESLEPATGTFSRWSLFWPMLLCFAAGLLVVVWGRRYKQILGTEAAYGTNLITLFSGLSIGWFWLARQQKMCPCSSRSSFQSVLILGTMLATVAGQRLGPALNLVVPAVASLRSNGVANVFVCGLTGAVIEFTPALGIGLMLRDLVSGPAVPGLRHQTRIAAGLGMSLIGGLGGLWLGGELLGLWGTLPTAALALVALLVLLLLVCHKTKIEQTLTLVSVGGVFLYCLGWGIGAEYRYGRSENGADREIPEFFQVGRTADVKVSRTPSGRLLEMDAVEIGGDGPRLGGEMALAYFPHLLRPTAQHVVILGLSTGAAAGASLLFRPTSVVCFEGEPAIIAAHRLFANTNHHPDENSHFHTIRRDERRAVGGPSGKADLLLLSYGDARLSRARTFFTKPFYTAARAALSPGGMLAHRLRIDSFTPSQLAFIARAVLSVFPHAALVRLSDREAILLASTDYLLIGSNSLAAAQFRVDTEPEVRLDLEQWFGTSRAALVLFSKPWLGEEGLARLGTSNAEQSLVSGWDSLADNEGNRDLVNELLAASTVLDDIAQISLSVSSKDYAEACHSVALFLAQNRQMRMAQKVMRLGLTLDPDNPELLADSLILSTDRDHSMLATTVERIVNRSLDAANRVGESFSRERDYESATVVFNTLSQLRPGAATIWASLAANFNAIGDSAKASECLSRALALDPFSEFVQKSAKAGGRAGSGANQTGIITGPSRGGLQGANPQRSE